jgi:hypothetical protein
MRADEESVGGSGDSRGGVFRVAQLLETCHKVENRITVER